MSSPTLSELMEQSAGKKGAAECDMARVVYFMFKDRYVCTDIKRNAWYERTGGEWVVVDCAHTLRTLITTDVSENYRLVGKYLWQEADCDTNPYKADVSKGLVIVKEMDEFEQERSKGKEHASKYSDIAVLLKTPKYVDAVMLECRYLFASSVKPSRFVQAPGETTRGHSISPAYMNLLG